MKHEKEKTEYYNTIPKGELEVYNTNNPIIKFLASRLLEQVKIVLKSINAYFCFGLDVGCGEGQLIKQLYNESIIKDIVAIDIDENRLRYAREHSPIHQYMRQDINSLGFETNSFDYVIATEIFEHLWEPAVAMSELQRVAKKNGWLIVSVPYEPFFHWGNVLRGRHLKNFGKTPNHLNFWSKGEFNLFLRDYITITQVFSASTFPWLLFIGIFR
jgi:ubiquinone/menaquinone biosynthesis C-methylase UbiE